MRSGEATCSATESAKYSRRRTQCNGMWKCWRNIPRNLCLKLWVLWLGRSTGKQESRGLCRKWSVEWLNKGSGRISITKKEGRMPEDWWTNWKESWTSAGRSILRAFETSSWNFKEWDIWVNVHEDKGTRLERKPWDPKHWHWRF